MHTGPLDGFESNEGEMTILLGPKIKFKLTKIIDYLTFLGQNSQIIESQSPRELSKAFDSNLWLNTVKFWRNQHELQDKYGLCQVKLEFFQ